MRTVGASVRIDKTSRLLFVLGVVLLLLSACGNMKPAATPAPARFAATPVASPSTTTTTATAGTGFTITVTPNRGIGGTRFEGSVPVDALGTTSFTARFLPARFDKPVGTRSHPLYTGSVWPSSWPVHPDSNGHFSGVMKIPYVLQAGGGDHLWLVTPGVHKLVLMSGSRQVASTSFTVVAPPTPSSPQPETSYHNLWPVNATTVWLTGERCQAAPFPTPDAYGNQGTPAPDTCQGIIEVSHDAGQTWKQQILPDRSLIPQTIAFADALHGAMVATTKVYCDQEPCSSVIYLTHDGGKHWIAVYHANLNTPYLIENGSPVILKSVALTGLVFTGANDAWAFGVGCSDLVNQHCQPVILGTNDGGSNWSQIVLPKLSCACSGVAHPTTNGGWIVAGERETSPNLIATQDGGRTWSEIPDPAGQSGAFDQRIYFSSASLGWLLSGSEPGAGQQGKSLYHTTDGGKTWTEIASAPFGDQSGGLPSSGYVGPIVFTTAQDGWIISGRLGLLHTTDGGKTWNGVTGMGYQDALLALRFSDPLHGWALSGSQLWMTADGGTSWSTVQLPGSGS